jgi:hypothetical protein
MADQTSVQAPADERDLMISDEQGTTVRIDVLQQKPAERPTRAVVKVGNALEF